MPQQEQKYPIDPSELSKLFQNKSEVNSDFDTKSPALSFGEQLVGIKFHPANDDKVGQIKTKMAEIANLINDTEGNGYLFNLVKGHALRSILDAQMTSVKLVTLKY